MKRIKLGLILIMFLCFILYALLTYKFFNGYISNLQVYFSLQLIPIMFWLFIILVCINLLIADTGFLKIGAVFGIVMGVFTMTFQTITNTSSFDLITSDKHELIVEIVSPPDGGRIIVYKKDSLFFSEFIGAVRVDDYNTFTYEIVLDSFIITICTGDSCITDKIDLE